MEIKKLHEKYIKKESIIQSLFRAGNELPSINLKNEGRVFGFSSYEFAKAWQKKYNYKHIYQFSTNDYHLDHKAYIRPIGNTTTISDNEYIALNIVDEKMIE